MLRCASFEESSAIKRSERKSIPPPKTKNFFVPPKLTKDRSKKNKLEFDPKKGPKLFKRQVMFHEKRAEVKDTKWLLVKRQTVIFLRGLKLKEKYFVPYRIIAVTAKNRNDVEKVRIYEGPFVISSEVEYLKLWVDM